MNEHVIKKLNRAIEIYFYKQGMTIIAVSMGTNVIKTSLIRF